MVRMWKQCFCKGICMLSMVNKLQERHRTWLTQTNKELVHYQNLIQNAFTTFTRTLHNIKMVTVLFPDKHYGSCYCIRTSVYTISNYHLYLPQRHGIAELEK